MSQVVVTARIDAETSAKLDRLCGIYDRKRAWLVAQAIKRYADEGCVFWDEIDESVASLDRGEGIPHEEIEREFAALLAPAEQSRAA